MKIILIIFLFSLSLISSGCFTYYPSRESPDSLKTESERYYKILKFNLMDGNFLDVSNSDVRYYDKYKIDNNVFVIDQPDNIKSSFYSDSVKIIGNKIIIPSNQIKFVIVERMKNDVVKTVFTITVIVLVLFYILITIGLHNNPPHL